MSIRQSFQCKLGYVVFSQIWLEFILFKWVYFGSKKTHKIINKIKSHLDNLVWAEREKHYHLSWWDFAKFCFVVDMADKSIISEAGKIDQTSELV